MTSDDPTIRYIRPEGGGLMVGLFETDAAEWKVIASVGVYWRV